MAVYVKRSCPNCNYIFDNWAINYMYLGCPISSCPNCKIAIKNDHISEWELISDWQKLHYFFSFVYTSIAFSLPVVFLMYLFTKIGYEKYFWLNKQPTNFAFLVFGLTASIIFIVRIILFAKEIKKSKERMQDQTYRKYLRSYGIIDALNKINYCEFCTTEVELTLTERIEHKFICPECQKTNQRN